MAINKKSDEGSLALTKFGDFVQIVAAAGSDNAIVESDYIDRLGYESAKVIYTYTTTLGSGETLSLQSKVKDCDTSGGSYGAYLTLSEAAVIATGESGGSTEEGVVEYNFDLKNADRYIKIATSTDLSAGSVDTSKVATTIQLFGAVSLVAS